MCTSSWPCPDSSLDPRFPNFLYSHHNLLLNIACLQIPVPRHSVHTYAHCDKPARTGKSASSFLDQLLGLRVRSNIRKLCTFRLDYVMKMLAFFIRFFLPDSSKICEKTCFLVYCVSFLRAPCELILICPKIAARYCQGSVLTLGEIDNNTNAFHIYFLIFWSSLELV